jgi:hypothetical protein
MHESKEPTLQDFIDIGNELDNEVPKKKKIKTKIEDDGF